MYKKIPLAGWVFLLLVVKTSNAQLNINGGQFSIEEGAEVLVQGDIITTADISGPGKLILNGTGNQNVNTGGFTITNLEVDNSANATLTGNTRIGKSLLFTNGKIIAGNFNLNLADGASATGMGARKFVETNGTGQVIKEITADLTTTEIPIGADSVYRPAYITTSGTYNNAKVGVKVLANTSPDNPPSLSDYIKTCWPVTTTGVAGTITVTGKYNDIDVVGVKDSLKGYYYNGSDWSSAAETHAIASNTLSASVTANGTLSGMDKFDLLKAKAFLQGPYNTTTGIMSDGLRTPVNYIPASDPYRIAPYATAFTHVNNRVNESIVGNPFADQGSTDDNIVDWVFLELRNSANGTAGANIVQTRSALIQRDGDIVDVDGVSAVTFNNVLSGVFNIAIRHRNHLGISTDPAGLSPGLSESSSASPLVNLTTATDAQIFGTSTAFRLNQTDNKVMLWAGNANVTDGKVKYSGPTNDPAVILSQVLAFPGNTTGLYNYNNAAGYFSGDINMDGKVKYSGLTNDPSFILSNVIAYPANSTGLYNFNNLVQQLPN